jgi:hypothetical protein
VALRRQRKPIRQHLHRTMCLKHVQRMRVIAEQARAGCCARPREQPGEGCAWEASGRGGGCSVAVCAAPAVLFALRAGAHENAHELPPSSTFHPTHARTLAHSCSCTAQVTSKLCSSDAGMDGTDDPEAFHADTSGDDAVHTHAHAHAHVRSRRVTGDDTDDGDDGDDSSYEGDPVHSGGGGGPAVPSGWTQATIAAMLRGHRDSAASFQSFQGV